MNSISPFWSLFYHYRETDFKEGGLKVEIASGTDTAIDATRIDDVNEIVVFNCNDDLHSSATKPEKESSEIHYQSLAEYNAFINAAVKVNGCHICRKAIKAIHFIYDTTIAEKRIYREKDTIGSDRVVLRPRIKAIVNSSLFCGTASILNAIHWTVYASLHLLPILVRVIMEVAIPIIVVVGFYGLAYLPVNLGFPLAIVLPALALKLLASQRVGRVRHAIDNVYATFMAALNHLRPSYNPRQIWKGALSNH